MPSKTAKRQHYVINRTKRDITLIVPTGEVEHRRFLGIGSTGEPVHHVEPCQKFEQVLDVPGDYFHYNDDGTKVKRNRVDISEEMRDKLEADETFMSLIDAERLFIGSERI